VSIEESSPSSDPSTHFIDDGRQHSDAEYLIQFLRTRDLPCPACGYDLRQLQSVICPECGQHLRLTVGLADYRIGAWVACILGCSFPAALGCIVIAISLMNLDDVMRDIGRMPWQVMLLVCYCFVMLAAIVLLLVRRRSYLLMSRERQILFGILPWASMVVVAVILYVGS